MSYAINHTSTGWRSINSIEDLLEGETCSEVQPLLTVDPKDAIRAEIAQLEGGNPLARPTREFMLTYMEERAIAAGYTVEQLRENHFAYRKVKEADEVIQALRAAL